MRKPPSNDRASQGSREHSRFWEVTCHMKAKDFKWLKHDMGLFEFPKNWDLCVGNDNRNSEKY